ncbi:MAG: 50S ribosomal protein L6 [Muribaculaceae bacterium]|nr:50S ribosomal protein L6 [Bacteroidales bacterium]MDY4811379.1 50S ribosomal protein L6 [Muribaculaceae bacterium]
MSRIGKAPIEIPAGVTVDVAKDNVVTVKGPKGTLSQAVNPEFTITIEDGHLHIARPTDDREHRAQHGLYRALVHNMVVGVSTGYRKELELVGVGYRATATGQVLELSLGYSHAIYLKLPPEVKVEAKSERNKNPLIILESDDKQLLGQVCAKIRSFRKPEPYKGKGIKFVGEVIRRKSGKTAGAK